MQMQHNTKICPSLRRIIQKPYSCNNQPPHQKVFWKNASEFVLPENLGVSASKQINSAVESWPVENNLLLFLAMEGLALFWHWVLPPVLLRLDFAFWLINYNVNLFLRGNSSGCFELKINWEKFWLSEHSA